MATAAVGTAVGLAAVAPLRGADAPGALTALQRSLHAAGTVSELLARASSVAGGFCGFTRALVLSVSDSRLAADGSVAIDDPACDALRRRALSTPLRAVPDSQEGELIRRAERLTRGRAPLGSVLGEPLGLQCYALAPIMPESRVVALLVVDRPGPAVDERDRRAVELFAHLLGLALERTVLRTRLGELSTELRHMTASANALVHEAVTAPVTVTTDYGWGPVFTSAVGARGPAPSAASELLTARELEVVRLMAEGRSNRDIADELHLAPNTIKAHVARLLRKLGASNRAEAVGRYLTMGQTAAAD